MNMSLSVTIIISQFKLNCFKWILLSLYNINNFRKIFIMGTCMNKGLTNQVQNTPPLQGKHQGTSSQQPKQPQPESKPQSTTQENIDKYKVRNLSFSEQFPWPPHHNYEISMKLSYIFQFSEKYDADPERYRNLRSLQLKIQGEDHIKQMTMVKRSYYLGIQRFTKTLSNGLPHIEALRLIIKYGLYRDWGSSYFARALNSLKSLKLQIYSESPPEKDDHPNWIDQLTIKHIFHKFRYVPALIFKQQYADTDHSSLIETLAMKPNIMYHYETRFYQSTFYQIHKITQWQGLALALRYTDFEDPYRYIKEINFPYLKRIRMEMSVVETLEGVARLKAPVLQHLQIGLNRIFCLKSVRKIQSTRIRVLSFYDCTEDVLTGDCLTQGNWKNIEELKLQVVRNMFNSIGFLGKMQFQKNFKNKIFLKSDKKIMPKIVPKTLIKKIQNGEIIFKSQTYRNQPQPQA